MFPVTCPHCQMKLFTVAEAVSHMDQHPDEKRQAQDRADRMTERDVRRIELGIVLDAVCESGLLSPLPPPPPPPPPITLW